MRTSQALAVGSGVNPLFLVVNLFVFVFSACSLTETISRRACFVLIPTLQVIYPFIDVDTRSKFVFVSGDAKTPASQDLLCKNFTLDDLEQVVAVL